MSSEPIHNTASDVESAPGEVMVSGPGGVVVSLTPDAASKTGNRLVKHAERARHSLSVLDDVSAADEDDGGDPPG